MYKLLQIVSLLFVIQWTYIACTPKAGTKTSATPTTAEEPAVWKEMGKPDAAGLNNGKEEEAPEEGDTPLEYTMMDEVEVTPGNEANSDTLSPYNPSHTFEHDLIHTKVEISFDWSKARAKGRATHTLRPWFYATDRLTLDAKNFDIHSVSMEGQSAQLKYTYDNEQLVVSLGRAYNRNETFNIVIEYTAKPNEREKIGGSAAITQDKGLYFINPDGSDPSKPMQIWTQGETESNSFWMPTIDKPNERCTQEMYITVEDKYKTLSNGLLVSSKKNADGTRTDYYKMDKPHAPYLFMMAIGEYAVVKDKWRNLDVEYYVEPKYEPDARAIFAHTPEMLEFFSQKLNYPYPWSKYSQVILRDYVSGAMENTTAVTFQESFQRTRRELLDAHLDNEKTVAHEMFHHWFGDLVTTESWANLTLNEGFANYSEYLWLENKYGRDVADHHLMQEQQGYMFSAADGGHPLIHFGYGNREDMFDAHSYNKGGCVLHMLRQEVGDEAFWAALNRYLKKNEYTDVESHELRLAFEDVTGRDLSWFFNQWYFSSGHPALDINYEWDDAAKKMNVTIGQTQSAENQVPHVFNIPMAVDIYDASGKARRETIRLTKRRQTFSFDAAAKPALVNVDADKALLCVKADNHTEEEWAFMYRHAPRWRDRWEALEGLEPSLEGSKLAADVFTQALKDKNDAIRQKALQGMGRPEAAALAIIAEIAERDPKPAVRASAISILGESGDKQYIPLVQKGLNPSEAYSVTGAALVALSKLDIQAAIAASKNLENDDSEGIVIALAELYAQNPDKAQLAWFAKHAKKMDLMGSFQFFDLYQKFLVGLKDAALLDEGVVAWKDISLNQKESLWRRFAATKAIADVRNFFREGGNNTKVDELEKLLADIKDKETDPTLKMYYGMF